MFNIGIITFRETASGIASFFSLPRVEECFNVEFDNETFSFKVITCVYSTRTRFDQRKLRQISKVCNDNEIKLLVSRGKPDRRIKLHSSELCDIDSELKEIRALKLLGALIRISQEKGENMLEKRIGFAAASTDFETVDMLSEEAASIMVFEGSRMDDENREALHLRVMQSKGVSIIFTKDLLKIIRNSDILLVDESIDFSQYLPMIEGKLMLGSNNSIKDLIAVSKVLIWPEPILGSTLNSYIAKNNDELLAVLRYCTKEKDYMEFLSLLPYIYMYDENGKPHTMP